MYQSDIGGRGCRTKIVDWLLPRVNPPARLVWHYRLILRSVHVYMNESWGRVCVQVSGVRAAAEIRALHNQLQALLLLVDTKWSLNTDYRSERELFFTVDTLHALAPIEGGSHPNFCFPVRTDKLFEAFPALDKKATFLIADCDSTRKEAVFRTLGQQGDQWVRLSHLALEFRVEWRPNNVQMVDRSKTRIRFMIVESKQ